MTEAFFPIGLRMDGRQVIIVGAGEVAARKAGKLSMAGAKLMVIAPEFHPSRDFFLELGATLVEGPYRGLGNSLRPFLVIAATNDPAVNTQVARDARALGALLVRVDDPDDSDITFPATLRRGRLSVSFATDGASPTLARRLRENAESQFDASYAVLTEVIARLQQLARYKALPRESQRKFLSWERISVIRGIIARSGEHAAFDAAVQQLETFAETRPESEKHDPPEAASPGTLDLDGADAAQPTRRYSEPTTARGVIRLSGAQGLFIVHTGDGKGKTSAAMNLVLRHLGHGKSVRVIQFIKNPKDFEYGDVLILERLQREGLPIAVTMMGAGYTWRTGDSDECRELAARGWEQAAAAILNPAIDLVVCDELHIALNHKHLDLKPVLQTIAARPLSSHVVTTGRNAPDELLAAADLVTDFVPVKHPYQAGVRAQAGIEY